MAQKKISELTAVVLASGSAVLPIVQDGTTFKITFANLTGSILNVATAVTASHALTALTASYAVSASHEITYELSSSFAETATSASHALTASFATTASYALNALTASYAPSTPAPLKGSGNLGTAVVDYYTDPSTLKRDNLVIHHSSVEIEIPPASNFTLGTVVEFDIYIPTGSYFTVRTKDTNGNNVTGFMVQGEKGFNQVDFNPQFNDWFGTYKQFGYSGFFNSINSSFGDIAGDNSHNGPALLRLVALSTSYDSAAPVTPASNLFGNLWAARIISRMPMSNSQGTNLAVEIVAALPSSGNSAGDLVIFNAGSGNKLHFYNGTGWDQL